MPSVMTVYGTRPEAIKVAPAIMAFERSARLTSVTTITGQHRSMLDQVDELFGIHPDHDLDIFRVGQDLTDITTRTLHRLRGVLAEVHPDAVMVQGDTTTAFAGALAAFYAQIPVVHLEAGLRTGDISSPYPEEANRKMIGQIAALNLAPTTTSRDNLLREGFRPESVVVTGNTVIDALLHMSGHPVPFTDPRLERVAESERPVVLVTTHRRENWGEAMHRIGRALGRIAADQPGHVLVWPAHKNPDVRNAVLPYIGDHDNVVVTEPLSYGEFTRLMGLAEVVLTDSGGVQEEAPSLGKPVLVLRENTERPEAVRAGTVLLIGTDEDRIVTETERLLRDPDHYAAMANAVNPYGDGRAAPRVVAAVEELLGVGVRLPEFGGDLLDA